MPNRFYMTRSEILTRRLKLLPQTRDDAREAVEQMDDQERAQLSESWLALLDGSKPFDPWVHGFVIRSGETGAAIGKCGFKGPPGKDKTVEIAYFIAPEHRGNGYATEAAEALVSYAFSEGDAQTVRAHTLPEPNASGRILAKCGFSKIGEVLDPEDGLVWRWERARLE
jgi:RimJ/RimL family protein N-acetyltransferase